jgi:hypothetical protein
MSNQRAGKTYRAAANDGLGEMKLRNFFRDCAEILEDVGQYDAAFYFGQVVDHINNGGSLPSDIREVGKILGV